MPFENGNKLAKGGGRKGYEIEATQLKKMRTLLTRLLNLYNKIYSGKATEEEIKRYGLLEKMGLKVMDKLHATKQHTALGIDDNLTEVNIHIIKNKEDLKAYEERSNLNDSIPKELGRVSSEEVQDNNK